MVMDHKRPRRRLVKESDRPRPNGRPACQSGDRSENRKGHIGEPPQPRSGQPSCQGSSMGISKPTGSIKIDVPHTPCISGSGIRGDGLQENCQHTSGHGYERHPRIPGTTAGR